MVRLETCQAPNRRPKSIRDVPSDRLVQVVAKHLKENQHIEIPKWIDYAKTGRMKEFAPFDPDWIYTRCGTIMKTLNHKVRITNKKLRRWYGGKQRRGVRPARFVMGSGKVNRYCIQQLEKLGWVETTETKRGRVLTKEGNKALTLLSKDAACPDDYNLLE
eukprot:Trichotokara_eunicae@DN2470_c0_g1_i1.p1